MVFSISNTARRARGEPIFNRFKKSTNGTYLNGSRISDSRYYELRDSDVIKFGVCTKEYVIMKGTALSKEEEEEQEGKIEKTE